MEKSIMWEYVNESKDRLYDLLKNNQIDVLVNSLDISELQKIIFVASGSSYNIATVTRNLYENYAKIAVETYTPSEFIYNSKNWTSNNHILIVAISQTGTSAGTIDAIKSAKSQGFAVLTITERTDTPIQALGDYYLNFLCGLEDCNAKTKGYNNSLVILQLLAFKLAKKRNTITQDQFEAFLLEIEDSIQAIPETIASTLHWLDNHKEWTTIEHFLMIGYGTNYGTAVEGMLKMMETLCIPASICDIGEFSHGFHRTISHSSNMILIQTDEYGSEQADKTATYLLQKVQRLLVVNASEKINGKTDIRIANHPITCSSLNIAVVFQVMAIYLPEVIGFDPNRTSNDDYTRVVNTRIIV